MRKNNINALDGLRGLAAYLVVISHFCGAKKFGDGHFILGKVGVMIFFILSGFLMGYIYLWSDKKPKPIEVTRYLVRRFTRVYPLFIAILLISYFSFLYYHPRVMFKITNDNLLEHIFLLKGVSVFWTIPVEFFFYFTFIPILMFWHKFRPLIIYALIGVISINILLDFPRFRQQEFWLGYGSFFLAGVLVSAVYKTIKTSLNKTYLNDLVFVACIAFLPFLAPTIFDMFFEAGGKLETGKPRWDSIEFYLLFMVIFLYACLTSKLADRILGHKVFRFMGQISYTVYLIHIPVLRYIRIKTDIDKNLLLYFIVLIVATTVLSYLIHRFFEKPVMNKLNSAFDKKWGNPKKSSGEK